MPQMTLDEAYAACSDLATSHYENFPVGWLVPADVRKHVHAVYAFARVSDDIADEGYDPEECKAKGEEPLSQEERLAQMHHFIAQLDKTCEGKPDEVDPDYQWIFIALADTIEKLEIPKELFYDLLSAFEQDIMKRRYVDFAEVKDYCRRSANPIGRLVLHLHGLKDPELHKLSDHICTALQLANFWQDVSVDLKKDRIYLPQQDMKKYGFDEELLFNGRSNQAFRNCMRFQVSRAEELFEEGRMLPSQLEGKLAWEIRLTWLTGFEILNKIQYQEFDTLSRRPKLSKVDYIKLVPYAWFTKRSCS